MSMIEPASREPVEATERKRLTLAEKATLLQRQQHRCAGPCGQSLIWSIVDGKPVHGPMIDEHVIPLQMGGSNDLSNRELRCVACAKEKTRADRKAIAKVARIHRRLAGQERPKQKIRSRGFPRDPLHWKNLSD
jgi:5-methylcytosine-specific restriction endonuclease McrA